MYMFACLSNACSTLLILPLLFLLHNFAVFVCKSVSGSSQYIKHSLVNLYAGLDEFSLLSALCPLQHSAGELTGSTTAVSAGSGHPKPENPLQRLRVHGKFFLCVWL